MGNLVGQRAMPPMWLVFHRLVGYSGVLGIGECILAIDSYWTHIE
jgi:hypothetical protein